MPSRSLPRPLPFFPAVASLLATLPTAQELRLNGVLPSPRAGDLHEYHLTADGQSVVYLSDQEVDETVELFLVTTTGGLVHRKLNGALAAGGDVNRNLRLTPDESRVVFTADQDVNDQVELYSVALAGGAPVKLSGILAANADVDPSEDGVRLTSDSTRVLFLAGSAGKRELFLVPIDGGATPMRINAPLAAGQSVLSFAVSPDGTRAVYLASGGGRQLYSAVLDGSRAPVALDTVVSPDGAVTNFRISADGTRVLFLADATLDERFELLSIGIDGGAAVALSRVAGRQDVVSFDQVGGFALFLAAVSNQRELFSAPVDGSSDPVRLTPSGEDVSDFAASPDGTRIAFSSEGAGELGSDLHVVPVDGSAPALQVNPPLVPLGTVYGDFQFSPDSSRLVYLAVQDTYYVPELYSAPADASAAPVKLNPPLPPGTFGVAYGFAFAAGPSVVFKADANTAGQIELWSAPVLGGPARLVNGPMVFGGDVATETFTFPDGAYRVSLDGAVIVYLADQEEDGVLELYHASALGTFATTKLNLVLPIGPIEGDVNAYRLTPDGHHAVYLADQVENDVVELFVVETDRTPAQRRLNGTLVPGGDVNTFQLSPDGARVAYLADELTDGARELFSVPLDGSLPAQRLNQPLAPLGTVGTDFVFSPDGTRLVFAQQEALTVPAQLWSVRADGTEAPVKLSVSALPGAGLGESGAAPRFLFTPDSQTVVFRADLATDDVVELWTAAADGSTPPAKLSGTIQPAGDVIFQRVSPAGDHVLYVADALVDRQFEVFGVPLDGSSAAVELDGAELLQGYPDYSPAADEVVFIGWTATLSSSRLLAAPLDGSAAPRSLMPNAPTSARVLDFLSVARSGRVVFRGDPRGLQNNNLYSVALDGSLPVRLSDTLPANGTVSAEFFPDVPYRATPDGSQVIYTVRVNYQNPTLHAARIDGAGPARQLSSPALPTPVRADFLPSTDNRTVLFRQALANGAAVELFRVSLAGGSPVRLGGSEHDAVSDFALSRDGRRALVRKEATPGVLELFLSFLPPSR